MSLTIKKGANSANFTPAPAGTHIARCVRLIDLGTQPIEYKGKQSLRHKVVIGWELPLEKHVFLEENGEEPFLVSARYTANLTSTQSALRDMLTGWRGKPFTDEEKLAFSLENIVGKPCYLTVVHAPKKEGGVYANVMSAIALPKGIVCPPQITPSLVFDLDNYTEEVWNKLHEKTRATIQLSAEWKAKQLQKLPTTAELRAKAAAEPEPDDAGADPEAPVDGEDNTGDDVPF